MDECPDCGEELDFLDTITYKSTGALFCRLYICHNEECGGYGSVYHTKNGELTEGDPSGIY